MSSHSASVRFGTSLLGASPLTIMQQPFGAAVASIGERGTFFAPTATTRRVLLDLRAAFRGALVFRVFFDADLDAPFEAFAGFFIAPPRSIPFEEDWPTRYREIIRRGRDDMYLAKLYVK
jgi:hypothetical protein